MIQIVDQKGKLRQPDAEDMLSPLSDSLNLDHVRAYPIEKYDSVLLIDTFSDSIAVVDKSTMSEIYKKNVNLSSSEIKILSGLFRKNTKKLNDKYQASVSKVCADSPITYVICPTYTCNNRCTYCYQQHAEDFKRRTICDEKLNKLLTYIEQDLRGRRKADPNKMAVLDLFGGEVFQPRMRQIVERLFEFARLNKMRISATTNAVELNAYFDLFVIYKPYMGRIFTSLDGGKEYHESRRIHVRGPSYQKIINNVNALLRLKIPVTVSINLDHKNLDQLPLFLEVSSQNNWLNNKLVTLEIGRVDDRRFETNYEGIMPEAELLHHLIEYDAQQGLPSNIKFAFIKSCLYMAERFGLSFNQKELGRIKGHFCWATSPADSVVYVDPDLDTFRCTYTVGKKAFITGNVDSGGPDNSKWFAHNMFTNPECGECSIGGYCSGGCYLSFQKNKAKQCFEEQANVDYFVKEVVMPRIIQQLTGVADDKTA
ncbi:MAG: hypothetical protein A2Z20_06465 [Bdellovibrionales bacterium RBG_16_40_8]|nr:MAG: hypothetical protein A2Z20_06465 [Bdellovibrionales bacterium RBG_16_40_8]